MALACRLNCDNLRQGSVSIPSEWNVLRIIMGECSNSHSLLNFGMLQQLAEAEPYQKHDMTFH